MFRVSCPHGVFAVSLILAVTLAAGVIPGRADKNAGEKLDLIWTHPDYATLGPSSIAFMPVVSYNSDLPTEHVAEDAAAAAFKSLTYRWISPRTALVLLGAHPDADSVWKVQRQSLLKTGRADSLAAPILCAALRTRALLCFRVDQLEKRDLQWDESGKPSTSVAAHAALVDSTGRVLWRASGSEIGEGALQDPNNESVTGVRASGLTNAPVTGTGRAPEPSEVFGRLFARWADRFPPPPAKPAATPATTPAAR
ncbi:MAG: hypothetical protein ACHQ52_07870 [Candidatus Eisenbacteria bacterium]